MNSRFHSHIDTIKTKEPKSNRGNEDSHIRGASGYTSGDNIITKYNPNNYSKNYKLNVSISETNEILKNMMAALTVIDINVVNYSRVDVATDIAIPFADISKFLELIHKCIGIASKFKDVKYKRITDTTTQETESYVLKSNMLEVEFYDKHKESKKIAPYPTRLEIRFLRIKSKDLTLHINNAIKLWREVPANLEKAEEIIIEQLKHLYTEELKTNKIANFNDFVCRYQELIFTRHILEELYKCSNLKDTFKNWLSRYKEKHTIIFHTKTEVKTFVKDVIKSLKNYIKK